MAHHPGLYYSNYTASSEPMTDTEDLQPLDFSTKKAERTPSPLSSNSPQTRIQYSSGHSSRNRLSTQARKKQRLEEHAFARVSLADVEPLPTIDPQFPTTSSADPSVRQNLMDSFTYAQEHHIQTRLFNTLPSNWCPSSSTGLPNALHSSTHGNPLFSPSGLSNAVPLNIPSRSPIANPLFNPLSSSLDSKPIPVSSSTSQLSPSQAMLLASHLRSNGLDPHNIPSSTTSQLSPSKAMFLAAHLNHNGLDPRHIASSSSPAQISPIGAMFLAPHLRPNGLDPQNIPSSTCSPELSPGGAMFLAAQLKTNPAFLLSTLSGLSQNMSQVSPTPMDTNCPTSSTSVPAFNLQHPNTLPGVPPLFIAPPMLSPTEMQIINKTQIDYVEYRSKAIASGMLQKPKRHQGKANSATGGRTFSGGEEDGENKQGDERHVVKDKEYLKRRAKNNTAAKKSRDNRRLKEDEVAIRAAFLERENLKLRIELSEIKKKNAQNRYEQNASHDMMRRTFLPHMRAPCY